MTAICYDGHKIVSESYEGTSGSTYSIFTEKVVEVTDSNGIEYICAMAGNSNSALAIRAALEKGSITSVKKLKSKFKSILDTELVLFPKHGDKYYYISTSETSDKYFSEFSKNIPFFLGYEGGYSFFAYCVGKGNLDANEVVDMAILASTIAPTRFAVAPKHTMIIN